MRCPHCGSPVPLGSGICIDCGAKLNVKEWNPWDEAEHTSARKTTGEREYKLGNIRQKLHEQEHTSHSTSKEAERDYEAKPHTTAARPTAARPRNPDSMTAAKPRKKKGKGWIIALVVILFGIIGDSCESILSNLDIDESPVDTFNELIDSLSEEEYLDDDDWSSGYEEAAYSDDNSYIEASYDDGSYDEIYYDDDGVISYLDHYDEDDNLIYEDNYEDGELYSRVWPDENYMADSIDYYSDDEYIETCVYTYYDDYTVKSEIWTNADGIVALEDYYDENGEEIGGVVRDEFTGEIAYSFGVDTDGNDLEAMYPVAE